MRKIEWESGTTGAIKERASALAWASNRRGNRVWVGKNVTQMITDYLVQHGYQVDRGRVINIMKRLADENYAYLRYSDAKKRVLEWGFMPDVELTGHFLPLSTTRKNEETTQQIQEPISPGGTNTFVLPPIPAAKEPPLYRLDELEKLLRAWSEKDHETYATWIDAAIESLQANT